MTKRPPQGRGSGGRVTPSVKATEAAASAAAADAKAAKKPRTRTKTRTRGKAGNEPANAADAASPAAGKAGASANRNDAGKAGKAANRNEAGRAVDNAAATVTDGPLVAASSTGSNAPRARVPRSTKPPKGARTATPPRAEASSEPAMASSTPAMADEVELDRSQIWGMGDMAIWWLVSFVATAVFSIAVGGWLISNGTYEVFWPNDEGWAIGEVVGRIGTGQAPQVTVGLNGAPLWLQIVFQIPLWAVLVAGPLYVARRKGLSLRDDFGFSFRALDAPIGLVIGVASQLVLVPVIYWLLFKVTAEQDVSASARALTTRADDIWGLLALGLIVGVGAPFAEELFYRGLSQHAIAKRFGPRLAVLLGAAFFALSHLQLVQFLGLFAFGLVLGLLTKRFARLGPAIFAHIGFNLTAAAVLVWNLPLA